MKKVTYSNLTQKEALEYTSKVVDFGLSLLVYTALNELLTTHNILRCSKYYKHNVKSRANEALKLRNRKICELRNAVYHSAFSETYWDSVIDICEEDVNTLRNAIGTVLRENGVEEAELFSQIEVTRILLEASVIHFEEIIKDCTNKFFSENIREMRGLNLKKIFIEFNIENIFKEWDTICDLIYDSKKIAIDLNKDTISNAFNSIADKFARGEYVDACLDIAKKEYPEFSNAEVIKEE